MTGILGKKLKRGNMYKIKYIHSRNNQLQPRTYERYYLLAETGEDENGVFLECVQVHDRLFEPIVKIAYIFTAALIIACLFFLVHRKSLDKASAYTISAVAAASVLLLFKKTNESADCCEKAEKVLKKYFSDI